MITLRMSMEFSRHLYKGSAYETSNKCGNCDGANCDSCEKVYYIYNKNHRIHSTTDLEYAKDMINPDNKTNVYVEIDFKYSEASQEQINELTEVLEDGALILEIIQQHKYNRIKYKLLFEDENNIDIPAFIITDLKRNKLNNFNITRLESNKNFVNETLPELKKIHIFLNNIYQVLNGKEKEQKTIYNGYVEVYEASLNDMLEKAADILQWKSRGLEKPAEAKNNYPGYEYFNIFNIEGDSKYHLLFDNNDDENIWFNDFNSLYNVEEKIREYYHIQ